MLPTGIFLDVEPLFRFMPQKAGAAAVEIVPFSDEWIETVLDLTERDGVRDPLYYPNPPKEDREEHRKRVLMHRSMGITRSHLVAVVGGRVVGVAKANLPPTCGDVPEEAAWLSLTIDSEFRRRGIGTRLVDRISRDLAAQGIPWVQIGMMDGWEDWRRFLGTRGFAADDRNETADYVLPSRLPIPDRLPETEVIVRPIRLPEEREKALAFAQAQLAEDMPQSCGNPPDMPAWWEVGPGAEGFRPDGFLVAEERTTGAFVGLVSSTAMRVEDSVRGLITAFDVAKDRTETSLRMRLLMQVARWLRAQGVTEIWYRVHTNYRNEEQVLRDVGFVRKNMGRTWRRRTSA